LHPLDCLKFGKDKVFEFETCSRIQVL